MCLSDFTLASSLLMCDCVVSSSKKTHCRWTSRNHRQPAITQLRVCVSVCGGETMWFWRTPIWEGLMMRWPRLESASLGGRSSMISRLSSQKGGGLRKYKHDFGYFGRLESDDLRLGWEWIEALFRKTRRERKWNIFPPLSSHCVESLVLCVAINMENAK